MVLLALVFAAFAAPTADELLSAMDKEMQFETRSSTTQMLVADGRTTRTYEMRSYGRGVDDAAVEYLAPERDKRARMLKWGEELWLYLASAERGQKIPGQMLRQ